MLIMCLISGNFSHFCLKSFKRNDIIQREIVFVFHLEWDSSCVDVHILMTILIDQCQLTSEEECSKKGLWLS